MFVYFYFGLCWVFVAACGLSLVAEGGGCSGHSVQASPCSGFSCGAPALQCTGFSSWCTGLVALQTWDLPGPAIKAMSSALQSVQLLSPVRLCDSVDCSMPGFPVHHQLPELAQTHWATREAFFRYMCMMAFQGRMSFLHGLAVGSACSVGDVRYTGLIPGTGRSPGGGHGNSLQYSCLENPMGRGAWRATVHGVVKSQIRLKLLSTRASKGRIGLQVFYSLFLGSQV